MDMGFFNQKKTPFNEADVNHGFEDSVRYPPTSRPPTGVTGIKEIQEKFNEKDFAVTDFEVLGII